MNSLGIAILELKRLSRNRFARVATIVVCLMPLLYSFLYLYAFWDPYDNLEKMPVAIVNQDQAMNKDNHTVSAGEELVNKLKEDHTVGWRFTDEAEANKVLVTEIMNWQSSFPPTSHKISLIQAKIQFPELKQKKLNCYTTQTRVITFWLNRSEIRLQPI